MDSGLIDCHSADYLEAAERSASLIGAEIRYVPGSNLILEELVSGRWEEAFLIVEPGETLGEGRFLPRKPLPGKGTK